MSERDLSNYKILKFIERCEHRVETEEIIVWIPFYKLDEFTNLIGHCYFAEGGEEVNLQENCIALDIVPMMELFEFYYEDLKELLEED